MLQFENVSLRRGPRLLFENASFRIYPGHKVGITGANGSGKSSILALISKELQADAGDVYVPKGWVVASVAQETLADSHAAIDFVLDGDKELRNIERALKVAHQNNDGARIAALYGQLEAIDGYTARSRAAQLLQGLGFQAEDEGRAVAEFSGGWRMRLNLSQALMCRSDLLLLDEPTNHLDLDAVIWLENWLLSYTGTLLLISHDRDFLDRITNNIVNIERQRVRAYKGNYSAFEKSRAAYLANQQSQYIKQQREIAHIRSYVDRFRYKATKARQAQSRLKALESMEEIAPAHIDSPFHFTLHAPHRIPNPLLKLSGVSVGYNETRVLSNLNLTLTPGDRIGLLGRNGAGKSTLIKLLASELAPMHGTRDPSKDLRVGYFAQHQLEQLHPDHSPIEHLLQIDPNMREQAARNYLGGFGFGNDQAVSPVRPFSGGEKSRLVLALLVHKRPNLLLLDEPTNHLDLEFSGAMVIVSHDRHLLRVTTDQLLLVHDGKVDEFEKSLDEYAKWLLDYSKPADKRDNGGNSIHRASVERVDRKEQRRVDAAKRKAKQPLHNKIKQAELLMKTLAAKKMDLETQLSNSDIYLENNKEKLRAVLAEKASTEQELKAAEADWLSASEQLEA
jgi:ATP-binding cassette subfamily F protein 3